MSSAVAALIAHASFWVLVVAGWWLGEIRWRGMSAFLSLWLVGWFCRAYIPHGMDLFPPYVAILAIGLAFVVFKGDVRLS